MGDNVIEYFLIALITINIFLSIGYVLINKKAKKSINVPRFLVCVFIPIYGILLFAVADFLVKRNLLIKNTLFIIDEAENNSGDVLSDISNIDYRNTMPIVDVLEISDIKKKRKHAFKSVKGDFKKIYPFLEKVVQDDDPEVVHYASTAISDCRQKINENYSKAREKHLEDPKNIKSCEDYLRAFLDLIIWEEFNNSNTTQKRIEISEVFNLYFSLAEKDQDIDEYYHVQKIKNEIIIDNFKEAENSCIRFETAYPASYKPYLTKLELFYFNENKTAFADTLKQIKYKDIILSKEANDIVLFWDNTFKHDFRGAV